MRPFKLPQNSGETMCIKTFGHLQQRGRWNKKNGCMFSMLVCQRWPIGSKDTDECTLVLIAAFVFAQCPNYSSGRNKAKRGLTLEVAGDIVLNLVVARRAEKQGPVYQRKLLEHWQGSVAQCTVEHVPVAGAESRQDEPAGESKRLRLFGSPCGPLLAPRTSQKQPR